MNKILNQFKRIFHRTDFSGLSVFGLGQHFDWKIILSFFLIIMIIVLTFSIHVFLGVRAGDIFKDDFRPAMKDTNINKKALDQVVADFDARAETLKKLQSAKPVFVDPSI